MGCQYFGSVERIFVTYTLSGHIEVFALELVEHLQELLHETNKLCSQVVFVLQRT